MLLVLTLTLALTLSLTAWQWERLRVSGGRSKRDWAEVRMESTIIAGGTTEPTDAPSDLQRLLAL